MADNFEHHLLPLPERTPNFGEAGMLGERVKQLRAVLALVNATCDRDLVISGCDFRFYRKFAFDDMAAPGALVSFTSDAKDVFCTDVMAVRRAPIGLGVYTNAFFDAWITACEVGGFPDDQVALNWIIRVLRPQVAMMPPRFWTIGLSADLARCPWQPGDVVPEPPADLAIMHGNFALGVPNKLALLEAVRVKVEARNKTATP